MTGGVRGARRLVRRARRVTRGGQRSDEGTSALELAIYMPIVLTVTFLVVQFALAYLANEAASSAAREASRVARSEGGTAQALADGQARGTQIVSTISGDMLQNPSITVRLTANGDVEAVVDGTAKRVLPVPFVTFHIHQVVIGPVEQFTPDNG